MAEFEDDYPVIEPSAQSAAPALEDDYPVLDPSTVHASNVPQPPEDDYPVLNPDQTRGVQERTVEGFKGAYHPLFGDAVSQIAPDFSKEHPIISGVLQNVLSMSPIGMADRALSGAMALPGAAAGTVAGVAENLGTSPAEASRMQRDLTILGQGLMVEPGMGWAAGAQHVRGVQIGDVGKQGLRELKTQGQTPGATAAPGVAQEPNPPAAVPVADAQNKTTLGTGAMETGGENLNTRNYGKPTPAATGDAAGVNVLKDGVDPTLSSTLKAETTVEVNGQARPDLAQKATQAGEAAREQPPMGTQVPSAEQAAAAQERITARRAPEPELPPQQQVSEVLDHASAVRLVNQPRILNVEAARRGITPDVLRQQAYEVLERERTTPAPEAMVREGVPEGTMELPPVEVRPGEPPLVEPARTIEPSTEALTERADPGVAPQAAGAAATPSAALPTPPAGPALHTRITDALHNLTNRIFDVGRDLQKSVAPMAVGSKEAMATVKDYANMRRRIDHEWSIADSALERNFDPEQRTRMWNAADEESVMRQRGETSEHMGIATLEPNERAAVESFQPRAQALWQQARDLGMVEGEGLPFYTPRMLLNMVEKSEGGPRLDPIGRNLQTTTPQLRRRRHEMAEETEAAARERSPEAEIARDIRTMPLVLAKMEKAIAGRQLVNKIKEIGRDTGTETVVEGRNPGKGWFTIDHPSFYTLRPRMEVADTPTYRAAAEARSGVAVPEASIPLLDRNGNPVIDRVPLYIRSDFEGPLRSILTKPDGMLYSGMMALKGKSMSLIMNSPAIHNLVEWGRAMPAMPGKVLTLKVYSEGNRAKNNPAIMREAIDSGLVPIGKRFFNQEISSIMEEPNLTPGRSWTSQVLGFVPGLFDAKAGVATKRAIDRAGDFWHNTLLWDRIGDLQMGLYTNLKDNLVKKGINDQSAARVAAHWANRYAGALPQEAMSQAAQKTANMMLFSRSFTLGNLGVMKDMFTGLPRDVQAQISRDMGDLNKIKSIARKKAVGIVMLDMGLMYVANSLLQSGLNVLKGDNTLNEELQGYADRMLSEMQKIRDHPLSILQVPSFLESVASTGENEPGREERIFVGHDKDGTAIYARNPVGKIGEEFINWPTSPINMLKRKLSTIARPTWEILANDKGFGRKIYDPNSDTPGKYIESMLRIAGHLATAQVPVQQVNALVDMAKGEGDTKVNLARAFAPLAGVTVSQGAPGGPAMGEVFKVREQQKYEQQQSMPEIRKMLKGGDEAGARARMDELNMPPALQRAIINPRLSPRALRDFYRQATPEQQRRFERARERTVE